MGLLLALHKVTMLLPLRANNYIAEVGWCLVTFFMLCLVKGADITFWQTLLYMMMPLCYKVLQKKMGRVMVCDKGYKVFCVVRVKVWRVKMEVVCWYQKTLIWMQNITLMMESFSSLWKTFSAQSSTILMQVCAMWLENFQLQIFCCPHHTEFCAHVMCFRWWGHGMFLSFNCSRLRSDCSVDL